MSTSAPTCPANLPIPVDLFLSKNHQGLPRGVIGFADSSGNIVFKVQRQSSKSSALKKKKKLLLLDSTGNPLISMYRQDGGSWQGFKGGDGEEKDLLFRVQRTVKTLTRTELEVFFVGENCGDSLSDLKVKGCPFQRSCTIYKGDSLVAQTNLMYKLHQIYTRRSRFQLTIFPGSIDHPLVAALVVIFFDGRKYWN